jgi:hypothetical protein
MDHREFVETLKLIIDDAGAIAHNQQVLADIHTQLEHNYSNPFEQDIIYEDHFGSRPSEPRRFTLNGVEITSQVLHQTGIGLRDIRGADLLYQIEREKFGLILYKRVTNDSIRNDPQQLAAFLDNCSEACIHRKKRPIPSSWIPLKLNSFCGSWYCVFDGGERKYIHACEAETIFAGRQSSPAEQFRFGLTRETFLELFSSCRTGALLRPPTDEELRVHIAQLLENKHLIYQVLQHGKWPSKPTRQ